CRQHRHEQRRPFSPAHLLQPLPYFRTHPHRHTPASPAHRRRSHIIRRQFQGLDPCQRLAPIANLRLQHFALQPPPLPHRLVPIPGRPTPPGVTPAPAGRLHITPSTRRSGSPSTSRPTRYDASSRATHALFSPTAARSSAAARRVANQTLARLPAAPISWPPS